MFQKLFECFFGTISTVIIAHEPVMYFLSMDGENFFLGGEISVKQSVGVKA